MATAKTIEDAIVPDLTALQGDIVALKRDVATLLDHLQKQTVSGARGAAERLEKQAGQLYRSVAAEGQKSAEALTHRIEEQPLAAVLVAAGIGYLGGRLLAR
jgi:ElaB/YqjD/DUF883 family membrane-anchored ribosome-binding protein